MQDNNKRTLVAEQDRAQIEMQIQTFKQSRGLLIFSWYLLTLALGIAAIAHIWVMFLC